MPEKGVAGPITLDETEATLLLRAVGVLDRNLTLDRKNFEVNLRQIETNMSAIIAIEEQRKVLDGIRQKISRLTARKLE
jgi:hypothetical protein